VAAGISTGSKSRTARRWKMAERAGLKGASVFMLPLQHTDVADATYFVCKSRILCERVQFFLDAPLFPAHN
jgi:hypothetical protein